MEPKDVYRQGKKRNRTGEQALQGKILSSGIESEEGGERIHYPLHQPMPRFFREKRSPRKNSTNPNLQELQINHSDNLRSLGLPNECQCSLLEVNDFVIRSSQVVRAGLSHTVQYPFTSKI